MKKSLIAPNERPKYLDMWERLTPEQKAKQLAILKANRSKSFHGKSRPKALEQKNLEGTCPDQLLDKIDRLARELGRTPTLREFKKSTGHSQALIQATFGQWTNALATLKLDLPKYGTDPIYTKANVIKMIQDFKITHGREPYSSDQRGEYLPSPWVTSKLFGTWKNAKDVALGRMR